jgi:hypothetical protein
MQVISTPRVGDQILFARLVDQGRYRNVVQERQANYEAEPASQLDSPAPTPLGVMPEEDEVDQQKTSRLVDCAPFVATLGNDMCQLQNCYSCQFRKRVWFQVLSKISLTPNDRIKATRLGG